MKVLIYRIGQLGDTLVALPALHVIRKEFSQAQISLLSNRGASDAPASPEEILRDSTLVDDFICYSSSNSTRWKLVYPLWRVITLWIVLFRRRFDVVVYLLPSTRTRMQTIRDWIFFRSLGVSNLIGFSRLPPGKSRINTSEADLLLHRLSTAGIQIPESGKGDSSLPVTSHHEAEFQAWALSVGFDRSLKLVGVGPGSRMQSKLWPIERYISVLKQIRDRYGFVPVVFGSKEDWNLGEQIIAACGTGYNATGSLSVKASLVGLKCCAFYLGNDTGTMHLAASAGLPCVSVFSHRAVGIGWFPYGVPFRILQKDVPCKGCELTVCSTEGNRCLTEIGVESVVDGCRELIELGAISIHRQGH